jgi:hypothetical protein
VAETLDKLGIGAGPNKVKTCVGTPRSSKKFSFRSIFSAGRTPPADRDHAIWPQGRLRNAENDGAEIALALVMGSQTQG